MKKRQASTTVRWLIYRTDATRLPHRVVSDQVVLTDVDTGWGERIREELETPPPAETDPVPSGRIVEVTLRTAGENLVEIQCSGMPPTVVRPAEVIDKVLGWITGSQLAVGGGAFALHAGAVTTDEGHAIIVVGPTKAGKSTLIAHLVHRGYRLMTDEQLHVLGDGRTVTAITRPISLRHDGRRHSPIAGVPSNDLVGYRAAATELGGDHQVTGRAALVAVLRRDADSQPGWRSVAVAEALRLFGENSLDLKARPTSGLRAMTRLATGAPCIELRYGDATDAADILERLLKDPPAVSQTPVELLEPIEGNRPGKIGWNRDTLTVLVGQRAIVYHRGHGALVELNEAATRTWVSLRIARHARMSEMRALDVLEAARLIEDWGDWRWSFHSRFANRRRRIVQTLAVLAQVSAKAVHVSDWFKSGNIDARPEGLDTERSEDG